MVNLMQKILCATAMALALSACSSTTDDVATPSTAVPTKNDAPTNTSPNTPNPHTPNPSTTLPAPIIGSATALRNGALVPQVLALKDGTTLDQVSFFGQKIVLLPSDAKAPLYKTDNRHIIITDNARYGYVKESAGGRGSYDIMVAHGNISKSTPNAGNVQYIGTGTHLQNNELSQSYVALNANFAEKRLSGTIKDGESKTATLLTVEATIDGTGFSQDKDGIKLQGNFYGDDAKELAGTYSGSAPIEVIGAFGGIKQ